jgi:hypothetical protein
MMNRILGFSLIFIILCLIPAGCGTGSQLDEDTAIEEMPEDFLSRPRFEKPSGRPLGRVLLNWDAVIDADGYEIQMSNSDNFEAILKNWTVRGQNLELPVETGRTFWFRIRAFNTTATSRWSVPLEVNEALL